MALFAPVAPKASWSLQTPFLILGGMEYKSPTLPSGAGAKTKRTTQA